MTFVLPILMFTLGQLPDAPDAGTLETPDAAVSVDAGMPPASPSAKPFSSTVTGVRGADLRRVAGSAQAITRDDLARQGYTDVHRVLQQVPGVYVRDEDGYGLRPNIGLRGAASDRSAKVTLMEDGVLFAPAPYSAPAAYFFPLVTRMDGAEIYKGPASIRFGPNTIGGALDFRSRPIPDHFGGGLDVSGGSYESGKLHAHVGYGGEWFGGLLEGVHQRSGGFKELDGGGDTGFAKNEFMLKARAGRMPGDGFTQRLELKLGYATEGSNESYLGLSNEDFAANPLRRYAASRNDRMEWTRTTGQLTHFLNLGSLDWKTTVYRQNFDRAWNKLNRFSPEGDAPDLRDLLQSPGGRSGLFLAVLQGREDSDGVAENLRIGTNDRTFVSQGIQSSVRRTFDGAWLNQTLELGARYHHDEIERLHTEDEFAMRAGAPVEVEGFDTVVVAANNHFTRATALYLQDELSAGRLLVVPGVRVEIIDSFAVDRGTGDEIRHGDVVPLGGLGAVYQLGRGFSVVAGAHQGFSPVTPGQAADVKPERSLNYEAGVRHRSRALKTELIGFFNDYSNLTAECTLSSGCEESMLNRQFNGFGVNVYGLEATASREQRGPFGTRLTADLAYTLTLSSFRSAFRSDAPQFGDVEVGDSLPYVPEHQGSLRLRVARGPWSVSGSAFYVSEMREHAGQGPLEPNEHTDAQFLIDMAAHFEVNEMVEVYGTVSNLFDERYVASRLSTLR